MTNFVTTTELSNKERTYLTFLIRLQAIQTPVVDRARMLLGKDGNRTLAALHNHIQTHSESSTTLTGKSLISKVECRMSC